MRRYFFDLRCGSESVTDDEGIVLSDLEAVRAEAMRALIAVARDFIKMPGPITVEVRDEDGPVMKAFVRSKSSGPIEWIIRRSSYRRLITNASRHVAVLPASRDHSGLVEEILTIACCRFRILVNRNHDCFDMPDAPPLLSTSLPDVMKRGQKGQEVLFVAVKSCRATYQLRPPSTLFFGRGSSAFMRSRSAQRVSILSSILRSNASADAVGMPALSS